MISRSGLILIGLSLLGPSACDDGDAEGTPTPDAGPDAALTDVGAPRPFPEAQRTTQDFIVTEMNFHFPEGLQPAGAQTENPCGLATVTDNTLYQPLNLDGLAVHGFDLDGVSSTDDAGLCGQADYAGADGTPGVDYAFLRVIDMLRPARPGQTVQTVLAGAAAQGLVKVGLRVTGVDDWENDDAIDIVVTNTVDTPLLGTDGEIIGNSSVRADVDPAFQSHFRGQIVDGVMTAGPSDLSIGHINLLVIQDRVITLRDVMLRATMTTRPDGVLELESYASGWWENDNMRDAIGRALQTIGANDGELDCVLDRWSDYSSNGEDCDGMSMIFRVTAVSGFVTGMTEGDDAPQ